MAKQADLTVTRQPVTRCGYCWKPITYPAKKHAASKALTKHYNEAGHPPPGTR